MKTIICIVLAVCVQTVAAQWIKQNVDTKASLRGLAVVNEKVVWASGTGGTVIRTIDGGKTWKVMTVPGAGKLDFRDVEAFDANTAYILSIGNGESSRIYKTTDGGKTWKEQFRNRNEKAFFDAMACWNRKNCIAMSDPVDNRFVLINTRDGGTSWKPVDTTQMPPAREGETAFAASGTCLITQGPNNAFLVTGGTAARVFKSRNRGKSWTVFDTPIAKGTPGSGIFSIAMQDASNGIIVGGNYEKPLEKSENFASTRDGGKTWQLEEPLIGYRSAVTYRAPYSFLAVGTGGFSIGSVYFGNTVNSGSVPNLNAVKARGEYTIWGVGPSGGVYRFVIPNPSLH